MTPRSPHRRNRGFSLIEIMIGIVIAFIAILVIYQVFAATEGIKRNTTSIGDAQQNGLFSSFMLGIELANAGNAVATAASDLGNCPGGATSVSTWRPIPVLITDGGADDRPDSFVVNYSVSTTLVYGAPFVATAAANAAYKVHSPSGFKKDDMIVAVSPSGACAASKIDAPPAGPDVDGVVTITHSAPIPNAGTFADDAVLFNMGPANTVQKVLYDVSAKVLRSTALFDADGVPAIVPPNPLASNVVNMKIQYGVGPAGGGPIQWKKADAITGFPWRPVDLLSGLPGTTLVTQLKTLKAVRIGIIVQGEQWDRDAPDVPWTLFGGNVNGGYEGTFVRAQGNYRYRIYETVIPLRNELWN